MKLNEGNDPKESGSKKTGSVPSEETLASTLDATLEAEYRKEYLLELRRRACPGCGEDFSHF